MPCKVGKYKFAAGVVEGEDAKVWKCKGLAHERAPDSQDAATEFEVVGMANDEECVDLSSA